MSGLANPEASLFGPMTDPFGRTIRYLRVSVTDRCDLRCFYCMSEDMTFLPKADLLTLEELDRLCSAFIAKGVRKLRLTGGEPLVRRNVMSLVRSLSRHLGSGALNELTLTTNGSQLARFASELRDCGVRRIAPGAERLDRRKAGKGMRGCRHALARDHGRAPGEMKIAVHAGFDPGGEGGLLPRCLRFKPLDGPRFPYSMAWLENQQIALLASGNKKAFVYATTAQDATLEPTGDTYVLADINAGPFAHG